MTKFISILKLLPCYLLRFAHVIKHFFCDLDECEVDEFEN